MKKYIESISNDFTRLIPLCEMCEEAISVDRIELQSKINLEYPLGHLVSLTSMSFEMVVTLGRILDLDYGTQSYSLNSFFKLLKNKINNNGFKLDITLVEKKEAQFHEFINSESVYNLIKFRNKTLAHSDKNTHVLIVSMENAIDICDDLGSYLLSLNYELGFNFELARNTHEYWHGEAKKFWDCALLK